MSGSTVLSPTDREVSERSGSFDGCVLHVRMTALTVCTLQFYQYMVSNLYISH